MKLNIRSKPWRCRRTAAIGGTTAGTVWRASPVGRLGSGRRRRARACAVPVFISFVQGGVSRYQETYTL